MKQEDLLFEKVKRKLLEIKKETLELDKIIQELYLIDKKLYNISVELRQTDMFDRNNDINLMYPYAIEF